MKANVLVWAAELVMMEKEQGYFLIECHLGKTPVDSLLSSKVPCSLTFRTLLSRSSIILILKRTIRVFRLPL